MNCQCKNHCITPRSCQVEQCIPGVNSYLYSPEQQCTCRPCTQCSCTCNNMENMYCPMDYSVSQQPQPLPQNACMPNMSCLNRSSMQCNAGGYKPNGGVSLNMINSPTRFQPESMCLPGQPICPGKDRGMPCMPCMPNSVPNSGGGQMDPSQACCRPRCMKFM